MTDHSPQLENLTKTAYYIQKPLKELVPRRPVKRSRKDANKSQDSKASNPFEVADNDSRLVKTKKVPLNHYQRYAVGKSTQETRTSKGQFTSTGTLKPIRLPKRTHGYNSTSVIRSQKPNPIFIIPQKPKQTTLEMINFKPTVLNLQLDKKKLEYSGYATTGNLKNTAFQQKKASNTTWKQPLF